MKLTYLNIEALNDLQSKNLIDEKELSKWNICEKSD